MITGARVLDCIDSDGMLYFVVPEFQLSKALGHHASKVQRLKKQFSRDIKIVELKQTPIAFMASIIWPLDCEIKQDGASLTLIAKDRKTKALLIGRNAKNLSIITSIIQRHFDIQSVNIA